MKPAAQHCLVLWIALLLALSGSVAAPAATVRIASNKTWDVYAAGASAPGASIGKAELFCLNFASPKACSTGAVNYGNPAGGGWKADLTSIQSSPDPAERAQWIWAPGITGNTPRADLQAYYFQRTYTVEGEPTRALLYIAVDDYAKVYVNGIFVGEYGSITSLAGALAAQSALKEIDITDAVHSGDNTILVFAQNGPQEFNGCRNCRYTQNSAGVVVGGFIESGDVGPSIPPPLLGQPGVPPNQSGGIGLYGLVPGRYDTQPGINALFPPQSVVSTSVPISIVNTNTGNHVLEYRDHIYPGQGLRFSFVRYYNSMDPYSGPLGPGWMHSYNVFLKKDAATGQVMYKHADGREVIYAPAGNGNYVPVTKGVFDKLTGHSGGYTITKPNRNVLKFSTAGKLASITADSGEKLEFFYDGAGDLKTIKDSAGRVFTLTYLNHLLISVKDATKDLAKYEYTSGRLTKYIDVAGKLTEYSYSGGQLVSALQPNGVTSFTNTFAAGRVEKQVNASGKLSTFSYVPAPSAFASLSAPQAGSCSASSVTHITDPLGRITKHEFDSELRLICLTDALGGLTRYEYDPANNTRTSITDPNGNTTAFEYGALGHVTKITDPLGNITRYEYSAEGRLLKFTNGRGNTTNYEYDSVGNRVKEIDGIGNTTQYEFDGNQNIVRMTDAVGNVTHYSYDAQRNLTQVTDAKGGQTKYAYDSKGNRTRVTNPRGNVTAYCYDDLNRLISIIDPPGLGGYPACGSGLPYHSYEYDALGNIINFTNGNGQSTGSKYDSSNRLERITYADGSIVKHEYDAVGNRLKMVDPNGTTTYTYDELNRMRSAVRSPGAGAVIYQYDPAGNRTGITYPDGKTVTYGYDAANRLTKAVDWSSKMAAYTYDAANNVTRIAAAAAVSVDFSYDGANRLFSVRNSFKSGSDADSIPATNFAYVLDGVGNRKSVLDGSGQSTNYGYDALNQLVSVAGQGGHVTTYAYDSAGNRTKVTSGSTILDSTYTAENVLLTAGSKVYQHDSEGNRISAAPASGTTTYSYNAMGMLRKVEGPAGTAEFAYDGDGNRIKQVVNGTTIQYVNDVASPLVVVLQESTATGTTSYLWGRGLISASAPAFQHYYLYDGLGSVVGVTGPDGSRRQRYSYDAWGQLRAVIPPTGTGNANSYRFTGEVQDGSTGLLYLRTRYYDPETGRFLSPDKYFSYPLLPLSLNKYVYVRNNPVRYIDRTGRDPWPDSIGGSSGSYLTWPFSPSWP